MILEPSVLVHTSFSGNKVANEQTVFYGPVYSPFEANEPLQEVDHSTACMSEEISNLTAALSWAERQKLWRLFSTPVSENVPVAPIRRIALNSPQIIEYTKSVNVSPKTIWLLTVSEFEIVDNMYCPAYVYPCISKYAG